MATCMSFASLGTVLGKDEAALAPAVMDYSALRLCSFLLTPESTGSSPSIKLARSRLSKGTAQRQD